MAQAHQRHRCAFADEQPDDAGWRSTEGQMKAGFSTGPATSNIVFNWQALLAATLRRN